MNDFMISFLVFLGMNFMARVISVNSFKKLESEKKLLLSDLFSQSNIITYGVTILIILIYFGCIKYKWMDYKTSTISYAICFIIFLVMTNVSSYKKLTKNNFPTDYIRSFILSSMIRFFGIIIFFGLILN